MFSVSSVAYSITQEKHHDLPHTAHPQTTHPRPALPLEEVRGVLLAAELFGYNGGFFSS